MKHFILFLFLLVSITTFAQNSQIKELEDQRKSLLEQIKNTDKMLHATKNNTATLMTRIGLISSQINDRRKVLNVLEKEIQNLDKAQIRTQQEIVVLSQDLQAKRKSYAKAVSAALKNRTNQNQLLFVLSGKSMTESYRRMAYLRDFSMWRDRQARLIKDRKSQLKDKKDNLIQSKLQKQNLYEQRKAERSQLETEQTVYKKNVNESVHKQNELQRLLQDKKRQADALNSKIEKLISEEVAKREKARKETKKKSTAKTDKKRNSKSDKKTTDTTESSDDNFDDEDYQLSKDFASNKGKLPYPVTGSCSIVGKFGLHQHSQWNVVTANNGIDIQAKPGSKARAVFDGEISRVISFPGFNNCIIIRHGGYYSFYANIQDVYVRTGDHVKTGQQLGVLFTDPDTNMSKIYFQLWKGLKKLDPEPWLK